jgi:monofunctional glycosyltransferase
MKKFWPNLKKWVLRIILWFFGLSIITTLLFRFVPVPVTILMFQRCFEQAFGPGDVKLKKDWVSIDEMSPNLPLAVVASEDQNFLNHNGFDFKAIEKAMKYNERSKKVRGASTISQQTAKNVFLWPGRSYVRKGLEVYFTGLIELIWDKERIMEVYLNVIEVGDGVYGVQAASREYFRKDASKLSQSEAAMIAALLPNPRKYSKIRSGAFISGRKSWIVRQMNNFGNTFSLDDIPEKTERKH